MKFLDIYILRSKTLHYLIPYDIINDITTHLKKLYKAAALGSMIYNMATFQRVNISLLVDCALMLR